MPIHAMMALDIPRKVITAITKICRGFLWCASNTANGGQCTVAWDSVCTPKWAGGLGLPNLKWMNVAMQARWPWLQRTDPSRPWSEFDIEVSKEARQIYRVATCWQVGDGMRARFWEDRWLDGFRVQELAPTVYEMVRPSIKAERTVSQAMTDLTWATDVGPELSAQALDEYLTLWDHLAHVRLNHEAMDSVTWAWEKSGEFSARSAYQAKFMGREIIPTADFTWKSRAPLRCHFFAWLALQNRCWTSDRLARRELDHQEACPFCDQHEESIDHILLHCVFAREVWSIICSAMGKPSWTPR